MCGIAGLVRRDGAPCLDALGEMIASLRHRGPDSRRAIDIDGVAAFAHARLAIIDPSAHAQQPMEDATGRYTLTFNGELYNFRELRQELQRLGHRFRTASDTETVVESYAQWGSAALARFNGMFAFAIWDRERRELVLARDRFGEKPLYYAMVGDTLAFASELRALERAPGFVRRPPSLAALNHFLALGYILSPLSAHPDVQRLLPAHYLRYRDGRLSVERFWNYADAFRRGFRGHLGDAIDALRWHVETAVASRLVADRSVGVFLSGGLDSSSVALFARRRVGVLHTFALGFDQPSYDESADARRIAESLGCVHHEHIVTTTEGRRLTEAAQALHDEPFSDTSFIPMVALSRLAARHVKVVLSGDGADELFGGYATYLADQMAGVARLLPALVRRSFAAVLRQFPEGRHRMNAGFLLRQLGRGLPHDYRRAHYCWREIHDVQQRITLLGAWNEPAVRASDPFLTFDRYYEDVADLDPLAQHLYVDTKTWLADGILYKVDRATMASSIEARSPFLDVHLAEFAAGLHSATKVRGGLGKAILRDAMQPLLPRWVLARSKHGFNAPVHDWFGSGSRNEHVVLNRFTARRWVNQDGTPEMRASTNLRSSGGRASPVSGAARDPGAPS